jgi:hypothetical protein
VVHFEEITTEIFAILDLEGNPLSLVRDCGSRLDFIISVPANVAVRGHDQDILSTRFQDLGRDIADDGHALKYGMTTFFIRVCKDRLQFGQTPSNVRISSLVTSEFCGASVSLPSPSRLGALVAPTSVPSTSEDFSGASNPRSESCCLVRE